MDAADEPGDRRSLAQASGREESPDSGRGELARVGHGRATRLVTPGGWVASSRSLHGHGKCHRK